MASTTNAGPSVNGDTGGKNPRGLGPALPSRAGKAAGGSGSGKAAAAAADAVAADASAAASGAAPAAAPRRSAASSNGDTGGSTSCGGSQIKPFLSPRANSKQPAAPSQAAAAGGSGSGPRAAVVATAPRGAGASAAGPSLPQRLPSCGVIDPEEPEATQKLRMKLHGIRVNLIRVAKRLGYDHENGIVKQVGLITVVGCVG
jgi:hypothetical protein